MVEESAHAEAMGALEITLEGAANAHTVITQQGFQKDQVIARLGSEEGPSRIGLFPGKYAVTTHAPGHSPNRQMITINPCQVGRVKAELKEASSEEPAFEEQLRKLDLDFDVSTLPDLKLDGGAAVLLDPESEQFSGAVKQVVIDSAERTKQLLGTPDERWPADFIRYGEVADPPKEVPDELTDDARNALREYVSGNSRMVKAWSPILDGILARDPLRFPVFAMPTVEVGPCAVLKVHGSGLFCGTLRVHATGTIKVTSGPAHIWTSVYEGF